MAEVDETRIELIRLARELTEAGLGVTGLRAGQEDRFLERFRATYDHLAATVLTTPAVGRDRRTDAAIPPWDGPDDR